MPNQPCTCRVEYGVDGPQYASPKRIFHGPCHAVSQKALAAAEKERDQARADLAYTVNRVRAAILLPTQAEVAAGMVERLEAELAQRTKERWGRG